ncbi:sugar phosphate nucleotidyltransferase [Haloarcula sp. S1AR25-5A]|uniref:UTP--glucose-1-phosphate uridylyltransferase n=1 Tax=Haloarcula terrestris TaxID=2950533 RepID=A0AAE4EVS4_9EURY|nr:sugar phosphate nucleotidyltransferase [Haloarcula terrestris]MDS0220943.1 sugar phosphate nucleotidyltransferase [Haloarcula terrestris]
MDVTKARVPWEEVSSYGVADVDGSPYSDGSFPVTDFVEKPAQEEAPSNLAITGRYVLTPWIFELLEETGKGVGRELQLTDAIRKLEDVHGVEPAGDRYDIGNIPSWLQANIEMGIRHDDGEMNEAVEELLQERFA